MINAAGEQFYKNRLSPAKRLCKSIFFMFLAAIILFTGVVAPAYASNSSQGLVNSITRIRREKKKLEEELALIENAQQATQEEIDLLAAQRLLLDQEYAYQSELVDMYAKQVADIQQDLVDVQEEEIQRYKELKQILRAMEESPRTSFWSVVFGSTSLKDVLSYVSMVSEVVVFSRNRLNNLSKIRNSIADMRYELQSLEVKYRNSLRELEDQGIEIEEQTAKLTAALLELGEDRAEVSVKLEHIAPEVELTASQKELTQPLSKTTIETLLTLVTNELLDAEIPDQELKNRVQLLSEGLSLVGNVPYFWGGRSYSPGWNKEWNQLRAIQHAGCENYQPLGEYFPYGLDCGGFVFWAALTLYGRPSWDSPVEWMSGLGATGIYTAAEKVDWESKLPGDLVVNTPITHIGYYLCTDSNGTPLYLHCCGNYGVIVSTSAFCRFDRAATIF